MSEDAVGTGEPAAYAVTNPGPVGDTTVSVSATAPTPVAGTPSRPFTWNETLVPAATAALVAPRPVRVSRRRCAGSACMPPGSDAAETAPVAVAVRAPSVGAGAAVASSADVESEDVVRGVRCGAVAVEPVRAAARVAVVRSTEPARSRRTWDTSPEAGAVEDAVAARAGAPAFGTAYVIADEGEATMVVSVKDAAKAAATARRVGMRWIPCVEPPTVVRRAQDRGRRALHGTIHRRTVAWDGNAAPGTRHERDSEGRGTVGGRV